MNLHLRGRLAAIDPGSGRAGVIYVDDQMMTDSSGQPLPQLVLAYQQP
jgi:hypothetical protein